MSTLYSAVRLLSDSMFAATDMADGGMGVDSEGADMTVVATPKNDSIEEIDPKVFWPVNGFILFLIISTCAWCYCVRGVNWWNRNHDSDIEFRQAVIRRRQEREARQRKTPQQRKAAVLASYKRCHVIMEVREEDLVPDAGSGENGGMKDSKDDKTEIDDDVSQFSAQQSKLLNTNVPSLAADGTTGTILEVEEDEQEDLEAQQPSHSNATDSTSVANAEKLETCEIIEEVNDAIQLESAESSEDRNCDDVHEAHDERTGHEEQKASNDENEEEQVQPSDKVLDMNDNAGVDVETGSNTSPMKDQDSDVESQVFFENQDVHDADDEVESIPFESSDDAAARASQKSLTTSIENDLEATADGFLILRHPQLGVEERRVPNCCAICLGNYEPGEKVVWSSNDECPHAFHEECMTDWLVKMQDGTPCPCCRAEFTDMEKHRRERGVIWRADHAFNTNVIRWF